MIKKNRYYAETKNLVGEIKKKLQAYNSKNYEPNYDIPTYFASYYNGQGFSFIKKLLNLKNNIFISLFYVVKDFISLSNYNELKIINYKKILLDKIVFTWGYKKNFKKNGSLQDNYFNINSRKTLNTHWIVLYLDKNLPLKIDQNITVIYLANKKKINFFLLLKILIYKCKYLILDYQYFLFSISSHNFYSVKILNILKNIINNSTKSVLFVYEAQPFQNRIIQFLKKKNIKTLGYIHSPPLAIPTNFIKKKFSPSKIFVNGIEQKKCFIKLGWEKNKIKVIPSTRFLKIKKNFSNQIFIPFSIRSIDKILSNLEYLIINFKLDLNKLKIRNHPVANNSRVHNLLLLGINELKKKHNQSYLNNCDLKNYSIFIGASGSIIEALERGCKVIQITEFPVLDSYSNYFWESIKVKEINENIFIYSILKKNFLIQLGKKIKNLNIFFKNSDI